MTGTAHPQSRPYGVDMERLELKTEIAAPPDVVFDLSRDIDFHVRSMSESNEKAIAGVTHGLIDLGQTVTWRARHFGIPFRMTSEISALDRPDSFTDRQVEGPFASFEHVHNFEPAADGTLMTDHISFQSPAGPIGRLVNRLFVARYLTALVEDRNRQIKLEAES